MSNIKLVHSGGNSVSLTTPDSNPAANRTFKLPGADGSSGQFLKTDGSGALSFASAGNPNAMQVLEEFFVPCNGTAVTMAQGSVSIQNVTAQLQATDSLVDVPGSTISYQPPSNTKIVIYSFSFQYRYDSTNTILGFQPFLDSTRVYNGSFSVRVQAYSMMKVHYQHGFRIESSADNSVGQVTSWNSAKTIKLQFRRWSSSYSGYIHSMGEGLNDSGSFVNNIFAMPSVGIRAIGSI